MLRLANYNDNRKAVFDADYLAIRHEYLTNCCHLGPIEIMWGITKSFYNTNIGGASGKVEDVLYTWQETLNQVTKEVWISSVNYTRKSTRNLS